MALFQVTCSFKTLMCTQGTRRLKRLSKNTSLLRIYLQLLNEMKFMEYSVAV